MKVEHLQSLRPVRRILKTPAAALLAGSLLFGATAFVAAQETTPSAQQAAPGLSADECDRLYTHQLKVIQSDPENPLYSSVQLNADVLKNPATRKAEVEHCRVRVSRPGFECQMQADTLAGLLECRRKFDGTEAGENESGSPDSQANPNEKPQPQPNNQNESYFEDTSTDAVSGQDGGGTGRPETMPSGRFAVNAGNCERAYNHIYGVISKTDSFQKRPDRARLIQYWQSNEARGSFAARCMAKFKPEDLGCLLSTRDADILQGCLLVIPPN